MQEEPVGLEPEAELTPIEEADTTAEEEGVEEALEVESPVEETVAEESNSEEKVSEPGTAEINEEQSQNNGDGKKKSKKKLIITLAIAGAVVLCAGIAIPVSIAISNKINAANYMSVFEKPVVSRDGKTIKYGLYPQTNVNNNQSLVNSLNKLTKKEKTGWYLYNNAYYAKASANSTIGSATKFGNGITIEASQTYWFKCEPITWRVLSSKNGKYYVVSDQILGVRPYNTSANSNKYDVSSVRTYLSNTFLKYAFEDNSYIPITSVNNGASTTDSSTNPNYCGNTSDKIFLPSYADYGNGTYGFTSSNARRSVATDYACAQGNKVDKSHYGHYWTRSPYSNDYTQACYISNSGGRLFTSVTTDFIGVRPAMNIRFSK